MRAERTDYDDKRGGPGYGDPMASWTRKSRGERIFLALLFAALLAFRAAVPTGFMPVAGGSGIVISVCTGAGPARTFIPIEKDGDQQKHQASGMPCIFAGLTGNLTPPHPLTSTFSIPFLAPAAPFREPGDYLTLALAAPPPPATGPPTRI